MIKEHRKRYTPASKPNADLLASCRITPLSEKIGLLEGVRHISFKN
jgi:hypothetical protein